MVTASTYICLAMMAIGYAWILRVVWPDWDWMKTIAIALLLVLVTYVLLHWAVALGSWLYEEDAP